jgi:hypothetical protein
MLVDGYGRVLRWSLRLLEYRPLPRCSCHEAFPSLLDRGVARARIRRRLRAAFARGSATWAGRGLAVRRAAPAHGAHGGRAELRGSRRRRGRRRRSRSAGRGREHGHPSARAAGLAEGGSRGVRPRGHARVHGLVRLGERVADPALSSRTTKSSTAPTLLPRIRVSAPKLPSPTPAIWTGAWATSRSTACRWRSPSRGSGLLARSTAPSAAARARWRGGARRRRARRAR